ncbi:hypothetical protein ES703_83779 [subsurface metagenome]
MLVSELLEDGCICASAGLADADGLEVESVEKDLGKLLWRINVETCAGVFVNLFCECL